jgi:transaldolase/glucose-6-phosphate isomerase
MIKVPGTAEGGPAVETLLTEGININITLLFSLANYEAVARAYISALKARHENGLPVEHVASVASFFVSRVDTLADKLIDEKIAAGEGDVELLKSLKGKVAVANAVLAYEKFEELFHSDEFKDLADAGAKVQRPLWASTGTKNPEYSDVLYVDTLIGPHTVNTAPPKTIDAFIDHGTVERTVDKDYAAAHKVLDDLKSCGIDIDAITSQLEDEGIASFMTSYDDLLEVVESKRDQ